MKKKFHDGIRTHGLRLLILTSLSITPQDPLLNVPFLFTSYNNFRFNSRSMEVSTDFNYFELKNNKNLDLFYSL